MSHTISPDRRGHVHELDGLRGILAVWIVVTHILCWCGFAEAKMPHKLAYFWSKFIFGLPAVETFMILSGFAISFLLHRRPRTYFSFVTGRFFRIYPVFLVCLILGILSSFLIPSIIETARWGGTSYFAPLRVNYFDERRHMAVQIASHLTLLNGLLPRQLLHNSTSTFLPPAWSITLEWQYYLVAPLLAIMVRSGTGILALAFVAAVARHYGSPWHNDLFGFLPGQLPFFLIGIGSYHLYDWFSTRGHRQLNAYAVPVAVVLAVAILGASVHSIALAIWALVFGSVFVQGDDLFSRSLAFIRGMLLHRSAQWVGKISYSLYLIHWPLILAFLWTLLYFRPAISSGDAVLILMSVGVPIIVAAAATLNRYVELPGMALGRRLQANLEILKPDSRQQEVVA